MLQKMKGAKEEPKISLFQFFVLELHVCKSHDAFLPIFNSYILVLEKIWGYSGYKD